MFNTLRRPTIQKRQSYSMTVLTFFFNYLTYLKRIVHLAINASRSCVPLKHISIYTHIRKKIHEREEYLWHSRTLQFHRFKRIHSNIGIHFGWAFSKNYPKLTTAAISITQMISFLAIDADNARLCCKCYTNYVNIVDHCISECPCVHLERVSLWDKILQLNPFVHILLRGLDKETLTNVFLCEAFVDL